jgi:hypothetical protein
MSHTATHAALAIRSDYAIHGCPTEHDMLLICKDLAVRVYPDVPFEDDVREVYTGTSIGLKKGLTRGWRRWLLAHALGHHVLHRGGTHLYVATPTARFFKDKAENQAEVFAGSLLFGALDAPLHGVRDVMDLARWAEVPLVCASRWVSLSGHRGEGFASLDRMDVFLRAEAHPDGRWVRERRQEAC